ncbi:hypothetical protein RHGRI_018782 [Rhododendron griersonianum]|uniref:Phytocyanin domain-containing protein n=1 Tax=Rhododendron griersonianum TaxID=479676 RepID=A0AAV6K2Q5_9ERIC|nr:hypothetical protein RHGRI_018782 [Rhododendron griersonianum]
MASSSSSSSCYLLFFSLFLVSMAPLLVSADQFAVGGEKGWAKTTGNDSETYNEWASQNRFHVGDEALFKYQKDSVLVVNKEDYENCITSNPISKFADGNTVFAFDHFGFFYFISGQPGHCKSGQRLIIRVMVQSEVKPPQNTTTPPPKPAEEGGGDHDDDDSFRFGPPGSIFSGSKMVVASSCFMTAVVAAFVILCWFV